MAPARAVRAWPASGPIPLLATSSRRTQNYARGAYGWRQTSVTARREHQQPAGTEAPRASPAGPTYANHHLDRSDVSIMSIADMDTLRAERDALDKSLAALRAMRARRPGR